jgi:hypothetical protein
MPTVLFADNAMTVGGAYTATATGFLGGTTTFTTGLSIGSTGPVTIDGGIASISTGGGVTLPALTLAGGGTDLTGSDTITVTGPLSWTAGFMDGTGTTIAAGGLTMSGAANPMLGRTLVNTGDAVWSGTGEVGGYDGAIFHNAASGTLTITNDAPFTWCLYDGSAPTCTRLGAPPIFVNDGTVIKSGSSGVTRFAADAGDPFGGDTAFVNNGTVTVQSGELAFGPRYTQNGGLLHLAGGNVSTTGTLAVAAGGLSGSGLITGSVALGGQLDLGSTPGTLTIAGNYSQNVTGTLSLKLGGTTAGTTYDRLNVSGQTALSGTLSLHLVDGYTPIQGDSLEVVSCGACSGQFATVSGTALASGAQITVSYSATGVTLGVGAPASSPPVPAPQPAPQRACRPGPGRVCFGQATMSRAWVSGLSSLRSGLHADEEAGERYLPHRPVSQTQSRPSHRSRWNDDGRGRRQGTTARTLERVAGLIHGTLIVRLSPSRGCTQPRVPLNAWVSRRGCAIRLPGR